MLQSLPLPPRHNSPKQQASLQCLVPHNSTQLENAYVRSFFFFKCSCFTMDIVIETLTDTDPKQAAVPPKLIAMFRL